MGLLMSYENRHAVRWVADGVTCECCAMQSFKLKYVSANLDRLLRLADNATLRAELTLFPISSTADNAIATEHRPGRHPPADFTATWTLNTCHA